MSSYRIDLSLILDLHAYDTASGRFVTNPGLHKCLYIMLHNWFFLRTVPEITSSHSHSEGSSHHLDGVRFNHVTQTY